jgi:hypothetical protein
MTAGRAVPVPAEDAGRPGLLELRGHQAPPGAGSPPRTGSGAGLPPQLGDEPFGPRLLEAICRGYGRRGQAPGLARLELRHSARVRRWLKPGLVASSAKASGNQFSGSAAAHAAQPAPVRVRMRLATGRTVVNCLRRSRIFTSRDCHPGGSRAAGQTSGAGGELCEVPTSRSDR